MAEKTYDGIELLSKLGGLGREEVLGIVANVKENIAILASCSRHDFAPNEGSSDFRREEICANCKGRVNGEKAHWYKLGQEHGK